MKPRYASFLYLLQILYLLQCCNCSIKPFSAHYTEYIGAENHLFWACCNALQPMVDTMRHAGLLTHRQLVIRSTFKYHASCVGLDQVSVTFKVKHINSNICTAAAGLSMWFLYNPLDVVNTQWLRFQSITAFQLIVTELQF
jgi:hypothetical protein